jgi:glycosyltransferase involved in cell wall biosynthesis
MRVAVVTPYWKEPIAVLERCWRSVRQQTHCDIVHYMVADGHPVQTFEKGADVVHISLPNCNDSGDTPRIVGLSVASVQGADAICLLDADCWFEPDHIATMVEVMQQSQAKVVTCPRVLWRMDGTQMGVDSESNGIHWNDTNCFLLSRETFPLCKEWGFRPREYGYIGDRYFWKAVQDSGVKIARSMKATVNYPTTLAFHYQQAGEVPPDDSKVVLLKNGVPSIKKYAELSKSM